jgi:hypothetical protein
MARCPSPRPFWRRLGDALLLRGDTQLQSCGQKARIGRIGGLQEALELSKRLQECFCSDAVRCPDTGLLEGVGKLGADARVGSSSIRDCS